MKKSTDQSTNLPRSFKEELSNLNDDLQTLIQDAKKSGTTLTKEVGKEVLSRAESIASRVAQINQHVSNSTSEFFYNQLNKSKAKAQEYADDLNTTVKEHPLASMAISFSIGLIISKVLELCQRSR